MNLYLLKRVNSPGYDEFISAIVVAEKEEEAILMHPIGNNYSWNGKRWANQYNYEDYTWDDLRNIKVILIGKAEKNLTKGVILGSFNRG